MVATASTIGWATASNSVQTLRTWVCVAASVASTVLRIVAMTD